MSHSVGDALWYHGDWIEEGMITMVERELMQLCEEERDRLYGLESAHALLSQRHTGMRAHKDVLRVLQDDVEESRETLASYENELAGQVIREFFPDVFDADDIVVALRQKLWPYYEMVEKMRAEG